MGVFAPQGESWAPQWGDPGCLLCLCKERWVVRVTSRDLRSASQYAKDTSVTEPGNMEAVLQSKEMITGIFKVTQTGLTHHFLSFQWELHT